VELDQVEASVHIDFEARASEATAFAAVSLSSPDLVMWKISRSSVRLA